MSGGVDSSVAAALLKDRGYEVVGMMLRLWSEPGKDDTNRCCTPDAMALARRVAGKLDIPFYAVDAKDAFREKVVGYFLDGSARGETPNPCLICNREIRWTLLFEHALALGADFMATGHYARVRTEPNGTVSLLRGTDAAKDQSYVLHVLDQEKLKRALFPIGGYSKPDVRSMAATYGLPTAARRESQDLCFLAGGDYREFLLRNGRDTPKPGTIVSRAGEVLGEHLGLANYTIGQRKGLGIGSPVPLYVLGKDAAANTLTVGPEFELGCSELTTGEVTWTSGEVIKHPFRAEVKTRYTARERPAQVVPIQAGIKAKVLFEQPQRDITPGQAAVFYNGEVVLGGGIIQ